MTYTSKKIHIPYPALHFYRIPSTINTYMTISDDNNNPLDSTPGTWISLQHDEILPRMTCKGIKGKLINSYGIVTKVTPIKFTIHLLGPNGKLNISRTSVHHHCFNFWQHTSQSSIPKQPSNTSLQSYNDTKMHNLIHDTNSDTYTTNSRHSLSNITHTSYVPESISHHNTDPLHVMNTIRSLNDVPKITTFQANAFRDMIQQFQKLGFTDRNIRLLLDIGLAETSGN